MGVKAVIIKVTQGSADGDAYVNPKAKKQLRSARSAGLLVHAYHYARFTSLTDAVSEANWCLKHVNTMGFPRDAVIAIDVEDPLLPHRQLTKMIERFRKTIIKGGYKRTDVYTMASWIWNKRIIPGQLHKPNLWIANYGVTQPGVDNVGTWQFTSNFKGMNVDASYDFFNYYTR